MNKEKYHSYTMNILLIYAHPSDKSFNHATKEAFIRGAQKVGHVVDVIDLYKDGFDPVLGDTNPRAELGEDVLAYQERIKKADYLAFIYPTFWYSAPAILEGFFDKVFTSGFAYKYIPTIFKKMKRPIGLLPVKKAVVIESYGGPAWYYNFILHRIPWMRFKAVLKFCGIKKFIHHPNYSVPFGSDDMRKKYLESVERVGQGL